MSVKVQIPTPMRQHTENLAVVEAVGGTVQEVLDSLCARYPGITNRLFDNGKARQFINFFLNDEDVRYLEGFQTATKSGDELSIIPAVAGGQA